MSHSKSFRVSQPRRVPGSMVQGLAALLWIPQAALLAWAVQGIADAKGLQAVLWPAAGMLALGSLRALIEAWGTRRVFAAARTLLSESRKLAGRAIASRSPIDPARPASGRAASAIAEQAEAIVPYLVRFQPARWRATVVPLVILPIVAGFSWVCALVLLLAAPLIPIFMALVGWRAQAASQAQMVEMGSMNAFLLDRLRGLATLRSLDAVDATARRLGESAQSLRTRTMAVLRIAFLSSAVLELFSALGVALVAAYMGFHLLGNFQFGTWGQTLSLGEAMFVLLLAPAFFEPLRELSAVWHDRAAGEAAFEALDALSQDSQPLPGALAAKPAPAPCGPAPEVVVRGLRFGHPGQPPCIDGLDLHVAAGEHLALMGPSGSGKSTLLSLLAGLASPQQGQISIGGVPMDGDTVATLRQRVGWMGQRAHVFAGSVHHNVSLSRPGVDEAAVDAAVRFAALHAVAQARPASALGEGGVGLSGGEAIRLALARLAAAPGADLLLVDEPTAHLDAATAAQVMDALLELARGKTLVVATHDPLLASRVGRIIQLQEPALREAA